MNAILPLPILIPLTAAILSLFAWRRPRIQRHLALAGPLVTLGISIVLLHHVMRCDTPGIISMQVGEWPAPFGITLVADLLSGIMILLGSVMSSLVAGFSLVSIGRDQERFGYYPIFHFLLLGVNGAFLTGDIFNLYVWFEVTLMASFVLVALGKSRTQSEGAIKYVALNLMASTLFLAAIGILYGMTGSLNLAQLGLHFSQFPHTGLTIVLASLFFIAFGIKAALFPFFFWIPASYHTPPVAVSAIFAALLGKVGLYSLIRVFTLLFREDLVAASPIVLAISGLTMTVGVLGALAAHNMRRILAFHSVSQMGYMLMGMGLLTTLGLAGTLFFIVHHAVVKSNLFLASGVVARLEGSVELQEISGLARRSPALALGFAIGALSLAGFPPFSGFIAKLMLIKAAFSTHHAVIAGIALLVSLLTLLSMSKIWHQVFWKSPSERLPGHALSVTALSRKTYAVLLVPIALLSSAAIVLGVGAEPIIALSLRASAQLLSPGTYISIVLGDGL